MKKTIVYTMAACLTLFLTLPRPVPARDWKTIRVGVEGAYPPFSFILPNGTIGGFDIDMARAIVAAAGADIELIPSDWDNIIPGLLANQFDCIVASMSITEERKKTVAFTRKYYQTPAKFVARKGGFPEFSGRALRGKTIGVQRGTVHDRYLTDKYGKEAIIKRFGTQEEVYAQMAAGGLDLFLSDGIPASEGFLHQPEGRHFEFVGPDLTDPEWFGEGTGIACRKEDADLVEKLNVAIDKIRADGTYRKIQDNYFDFNVYGEE